MPSETDAVVEVTLVDDVVDEVFVDETFATELAFWSKESSDGPFFELLFFAAVISGDR
jgi:hypothetical protein